MENKLFLKREGYKELLDQGLEPSIIKEIFDQEREPIQELQKYSGWSDNKVKSNTLTKVERNIIERVSSYLYNSSKAWKLGDSNIELPFFTLLEVQRATGLNISDIENAITKFGNEIIIEIMGGKYYVGIESKDSDVEIDSDQERERNIPIKKLIRDSRYQSKKPNSQQVQKARIQEDTLERKVEIYKRLRRRIYFIPVTNEKLYINDVEDKEVERLKIKQIKPYLREIYDKYKFSSLNWAELKKDFREGKYLLGNIFSYYENVDLRELEQNQEFMELFIDIFSTIEQFDEEINNPELKNRILGFTTELLLFGGDQFAYKDSVVNIVKSVLAGKNVKISIMESLRWLFDDNGFSIADNLDDCYTIQNGRTMFYNGLSSYANIDNIAIRLQNLSTKYDIPIGIKYFQFDSDAFFIERESINSLIFGASKQYSNRINEYLKSLNLDIQIESTSALSYLQENNLLETCSDAIEELSEDIYMGFLKGDNSQFPYPLTRKLIEDKIIRTRKFLYDRVGFEIKFLSRYGKNSENENLLKRVALSLASEMILQELILFQSDLAIQPTTATVIPSETKYAISSLNMGVSLSKIPDIEKRIGVVGCRKLRINYFTDERNG